MRIHIRRISPPSLSVVLGVIYGLAGIVIAGLSFFGALVSLGIGVPIRDDFFSMVTTLVIQPVLSALFGVMTGFIVAWVYNCVARFTKGVLVEHSEAGRHDD